MPACADDRCRIHDVWQEYAAYLNFDLSAHPDLEWLAAEAIDAPLPPSWATFEDEKQNQARPPFLDNL